VAEPASFVSDVKVQPRAIAIEVASTVEVTRSYTETQQLLAYDVQHESIDALVLSVPQSMIDGNRVNLRVSLDDQPLVPQITASPQAGRAEITVNLPEPVLGAFQLAVNHQRATNPEFTTEQPQDIDVPLVLPAADPGSGGYTTIISNKLSVTYDEGLQVKAREGTWSMRQSTNGTAGRLALTSASDADHATLQVTLSPNRSGSTTLHQAWIQTWLAGDRRRDRAVFRIRTSESQLNVTLPESADLDESRVAIAVDRQAVENKQVSPSGEITIVLGQREDDWQQEHVVEVWYSIEGVRPVEGTMRLQAATIDADDRTERCFWQLVFPSNELLVRGDSQFTPELAWRWQNFGWQRQPLREQQDLEDWIGASRQDPLPLATNRYVFTSFGVPGQLEVVTLARSWILLIASGVTLAVGLLLIYVPVLRHPACLLTAGVVLLGLAMVRPEFSVVLAQAAVLGIVLVVVARLLRHAVSRGSAEPAVHGRSQFADSKTTEVQYPRGEGSSRVTTGSAPVAIQMRTAEPKS
jgi:hypothetical protein